MSTNNISLNPDQALASVTKLMDSQDVASTVRTQVESHGTSAGPTNSFKFTLNQYVHDIKIAMDELRGELDEFQTEITARVQEMGQLDEELAGQSAQFTAAVTSVVITDTVKDAATAVTSTFGTKATKIG